MIRILSSVSRYLKGQFQPLYQTHSGDPFSQADREKFLVGMMKANFLRHRRRVQELAQADIEARLLVGVVPGRGGSIGVPKKLRRSVSAVFGGDGHAGLAVDALLSRSSSSVCFALNCMA